MRIRRIVRAMKKPIIFLKLIKTIIVFLKKKKSLSNRDFLFKSKMKNVYSHFINIEFNFVNIRNDNDFSFIISHRYKINSIIKYEIKKVYFVKLKNHSLIVKSS